MSRFANSVLVLNKSWAPIDLSSAYDAISDVYTGRAAALDDHYVMYNFDSWLEMWDGLGSQGIGERLTVNAVHFTVVVPRIIVLRSYKGYRSRRLAPNRENVFKRDEYLCQYCGRKFSKSKLTRDHVFPESRGGKATWKNIATACTGCNGRKNDRTPDEARMPLMRKPFEPSWYSLANEIPESWKPFIKPRR